MYRTISFLFAVTAFAGVMFGGSPARADCVQSGASVTCTGIALQGFVAPDVAVNVQIAPTAFVRNFSTPERFGNCFEDILTLPAIFVGDGSAVTNQGQVFGIGVCGGGIYVGNTSTVLNTGTIYTNDNVAYGIATGNGATIVSSGSITTNGTSSFGILTGDDANVTLAAGGLVTTVGAGAPAVTVGDFSTVTNAGVISTTGGAADGIDAGQQAQIANSGIITVAGAGAIGINAEGDGASIVNSGQIQAVYAGAAPAAHGAGIVASGQDIGVANSGLIVGSFAGISVDTTGAAIITNTGTVIGGGEATRNTADAASEAAILIQGSNTATVQLTNSGQIDGIGGAAAILSQGPSLSLSNSGLISGDVRLGAGDNFVSLQSGSILLGALDGGSGTNTLVMNGQGVLSGAVSNFQYLLHLTLGTWTLTEPVQITTQTVVSVGELALTNGSRLDTPLLTVAGGTLSGTGTITGTVVNGGIVTPGAGLPAGTLSVGAYQQESTGTLLVRLDTAGDSSHLAAAGRVLLGGALQVQLLPESGSQRYQSGQQFALISGSGLSTSGAFATITSNAGAFLTVTPETEADGSMALAIQRLPYASAAANAGERNLAGMLDRGQANPDPLLAPILDALDFDSAATARGVFDQLAPQTVPSLETLGLFALDSIDTAIASTVSADNDAPFRAWAQFLHRAGNVGGTDGSAYAYDLNGEVAGIDGAITRELRLGLVAAHVEGSSAFDATNATANLSLSVAAATAQLRWKSVQFAAGFAYGDGTAAKSRTQILQGAAQSLAAQADIAGMSAFANASTRWTVGMVSILPRAGLQYDQVRIGALAEKAPLALATSAATARSVESEAAIEAIGRWRIAPFVELRWSQELSSGRRTAPAQLVDVADSTFTIAGAAPRRAVLWSRAGVAAEIVPGLSAQLSFETAANDPLSGQTLNAGLVWRW